RRSRRPAPRRADRGSRSGAAPAALGTRRRAPRGRRRRGLRVAAPGGDRAPRRPGRGTARRPAGLHRLGRRLRPPVRRHSVRMNRIWLVLRKDALVLRRSPLLFGILIAYPVAIALLIGLVAGY